MNKKPIYCFSVSVLLSLTTLPAMGAETKVGGDAESGKAKAAACAACHGPDGNSPTPDYPKLAGQHERYVADQLLAYKSGARNNALMTPMVANLSEQDMDALIEFVLSL